MEVHFFLPKYTFDKFCCYIKVCLFLLLQCALTLTNASSGPALLDDWLMDHETGFVEVNFNTQIQNWSDMFTSVNLLEFDECGHMEGARGQRFGNRDDSAGVETRQAMRAGPIAGGPERAAANSICSRHRAGQNKPKSEFRPLW
jgi:hypothetical protein